MMVLVTYDVNTQDAKGRRRLSKVAKACVNVGQRVQNSVFECLLDPAQFAMFKHTLTNLIDPDKDSLRFYLLGANWKGRVEHIGAKASYDPEGIMIT
ncbi:MAG: CRISPR-associated endoribonuclease Cas2 [Firmicutes bacterium ADurb.Bin506]|nr:MAG: CRISPR-associated endoribonuclease Cas2 [Firmicutes bacterium ADurb.Bin506]